MRPAQEVKRFHAGECGPQADLAGDVRDALVRLDRILRAIDAEDLCASGRRADETEEEPDRRGLAGAVRAEVAEDLARRDLEIERDEGAGVAVRLR